MSTGNRIPLATAQKLAGRLVAALAPACERIEVAGSIRRGKADVGDVELVAIPVIDSQGSALDRLLLTLIDEGKLQRKPVYPKDRPAWGEKYKKFWVLINSQQGPIQVDLFLATPENWGAIFTIRTGPSDFSKELVTHIKYKTPYRQDGGHLVRKDNGGIVLTPDEETYFAAAGLQYIAPEWRTVEKLRLVIRLAQAKKQPGV